MDESYSSMLADGVEKKMRTLETDIMTDIVRRIKKTGKITSTADWQISRLAILGTSSEDIRKLIEKAVDGNQEEVERLYAEVIANEYTAARPMYEAVGKEFIPYEQNAELQQAVNAMVTQSNEDLFNITKSTGFMLDYNGKKVFTPLSEVYNEYLDDAVMGMVSGAYDYNTMVRRMVNQMTASGLRTDHQFKDGGKDYGIDYPSGHHNRIDVAARRALLTGFSQVAGRITDTNAQKLNTDHFEVTWHAGARPDHVEWQGKVYSKEELKTVCGLGQGGGLLGWNCRHSYYPFIPGVSKRNWPDEWLEEKNAEEAQPTKWKGREYNTYQATQHQRQLETAMRARREQVQMLREAGADPDDIMNARCRYHATMQEYNAFSRAMNLPTQMERVYTGRTAGRISPSPKAFANWQAEQANKEKERAENRRRKDMDNAAKGQRYRPVTRGESAGFSYDRNTPVSARKIDTYAGNVYIADNVKIKPKALHQINQNTEEAMKAYGIPMDRKPTMVIANAQDILSYGKYDAVNNTVFYANDIADKGVMKDNGGLGSTERHEMWHLKQAENYRGKGKNITADNYNDYIANACASAKINLERLGVSEYNVSEISEYAKTSWNRGRYDEVEAEYMRKKGH